MTCMQPPDDAEQRLLRLLALKRHEVPPPGFFDQLPVRILVNLRAGSEIEDIPWWTRAWRMVIQEPMIGLSYAALGVGAVLFGVSVLETAIDVQSPPVGLSQGILSSSTTDLIFADPQGATPGVIYRVAEPTPSTWFQPTTASFAPVASAAPTPYTPFSRSNTLGPIPVSYPSSR